MPQPRSSSRIGLARLVLFLLFGRVLLALGRRSDERAARDRSAPAGEARAERAPAPAFARGRPRTRRQRLATSLAFATLFFAGAALSAGAGDMLVGTLETDAAEQAEQAEGTPPEDGETVPEAPPAETPEAPPAPETPEEAPPTDPAPGEAPPADPAPGETPAPGGTGGGTGGSAPGDAGSGGKGSSGSGGGSNGGKGGKGGAKQSTPAGPPVVAPHAHAHDHATRELDHANEGAGGSTVWLHRTLPDPTPPARRLAPDFAELLRSEARKARVDWALVLGALRADGRISRSPATRAEVRSLARSLARLQARGEWQGFLALRGRTAYADRAQAFTRYNRAVGLRSLVTGLDAAKDRLGVQVLDDRRILVYQGGRADIAAGRVDVRLLVLLRYLAEAHDQVTVSSLISGHRYFSRPGVVSAHMYGLAVDIPALGGSPILGNSQPGGLTEHAVRNILLLPAELRPQQVISLLGLGGPSFPLANHHDHIHVGY